MTAPPIRTKPPTGTTQPPAPSPDGPFDAGLLVAVAALAVAMCLITGTIAHSSEHFQSSELSFVLNYISVGVQFVAGTMGLVLVGVGWPGRGSHFFAATMAGLGGSSCAVISRGIEGHAALFWVLSGAYVGCLVELFVRPFASLAECLDQSVAPEIRAGQQIRKD